MKNCLNLPLICLKLIISFLFDDQAVRILTIHKSKGLEFDSTIIMAVENEIFLGIKMLIGVLSLLVYPVPNVGLHTPNNATGLLTMQKDGM